MPGHLLLRFCLRLQLPPPPPLPRLPPPRGIVANPPSFPPPSAHGCFGNPQPSGAPAPLGWQECECRVWSARPARAEGPAVRKCQPRRNHRVHALEGRPRVFGEAQTAGWAGLEPFPACPLPGLFWVPPGGGATPSCLELSRNPSCHCGRGLGSQSSKPPILQLGQLRSREKEGFPGSQSRCNENKWLPISNFLSPAPTVCQALCWVLGSERQVRPSSCPVPALREHSDH